MEAHSMSLGIDGHWIGIHDGDARALALAKRHYSWRRKARGHNIGNPSFGGIGEKMVLITADCKAVFLWRYSIQDPAILAKWGWQSGVACTMFRNEGPILSSVLIREAMDLAWQRWPGQRLFTYVWDAKVKSANPGYCFKQAGWRMCGRNKDGRLTILEAYPESVE